MDHGSMGLLAAEVVAGSIFWLWVFLASLASVFVLAPTRNFKGGSRVEGVSSFSPMHPKGVESTLMIHIQNLASTTREKLVLFLVEGQDSREQHKL